jgi:cytochrome P450
MADIRGLGEAVWYALNPRFFMLSFMTQLASTGDLTYLSLLGSDVLIVNSRATLSALFEGKSANISDRPSLYFACELVGWKELPAMMSMGPAHTHHRRLMAQTIGTKSLMVDIQDMVESQVYRFLQRAVNEPERLEHHIRT